MRLHTAVSMIQLGTAPGSQRNQADGRCLNIQLLADQSHIVTVRLIRSDPIAGIVEILDTEGLEQTGRKAESGAVIRACVEQRHGNGHQIDTDRVEPAFFFEVEPPESNALLWQHKYWGHVQFEDIKIECINEI